MTAAAEDGPAVSVIVCVRNGESVIGRQLQALDRQIGHPAFEIIVCSNASTDGTDRVVRSWIRRDDHPAVRAVLIRADERPSIPYARNAAVRASRGRVVAFCDADDEVDPHWVGAMAQGTPPDGMAGGRVLLRTSRGTPHPGGFPVGLVNLGYLPYAVNCNLAISRRLFEGLGGYDESLPRYGFEDVDLSWRVQKSGRPLVYVPDAVVRQTLSGGSVMVRKKFLLGKGRVLMAHRYPGYDRRRYSLGLCLRDAGLATVSAARHAVRDREKLRRVVGETIASYGRLYGYLSYEVFGSYPEARFLGPAESSTSAVRHSAAEGQDVEES